MRSCKVKIENLSRLFQAISLATLLFTFSCDSSDKEDNNKSSKSTSSYTLTIDKNLSQLTWGDTVNIEVLTTSDTLSIRHITLTVGKREIKQSESNIISLLTADLGVGKKTVEIKMVFDNDQTETTKKRLTIRSNITPAELTYKVIQKFPHDPDSYTQGLLFSNGRLIESTGQKTKSTLREVNLNSGEVIQQVKLEDQYFGEGLTLFNDKLYQLTWQSHTGFIYDNSTFEQIGTFNYANEGWGLTTVDSSIFMSDGTNLLYVLNPSTLEREDIVQVYDHKGPVMMLNELEYFNNKIYANVYQTDIIVAIDPQTGRVLESIDLTNIFNKNNYGRKLDVLNGIAYDHITGNVYVTGKYWPKLFQVEFVKKP